MVMLVVVVMVVMMMMMMTTMMMMIRGTQPQGFPRRVEVKARLLCKCLIISKCSKCSLLLHCATTDDSGPDDTQCYHGGD